jgi:hypothetical protein
MVVGFFWCPKALGFFFQRSIKFLKQLRRRTQNKSQDYKLDFLILCLLISFYCLVFSPNRLFPKFVHCYLFIRKYILADSKTFPLLPLRGSEMIDKEDLHDLESIASIL